MQTVTAARAFARTLILSLVLDPRALTVLAAVAALCAGLLLGAGDASAAPGVPGGGGHRP